MENEIWKMIDSQKKYAVSNLGRVKNCIDNNFVAIGKTSLGYNIVNLRVAGRCKTVSVARLVADAFLERPTGSKTVRHLAGKDNDCACNLEWVVPRSFQNVKPHTAGGFERKKRKAAWLRKKVNGIKQTLASIEQDAISIGGGYNFWQEDEEVKAELRRLDALLRLINGWREL
jgi:hypothetical protein